MPLVARKRSWSNGIKKLKGERKQVEEEILGEVVGLDGVGGLVDPMMVISGRKHSKQALQFWAFLSL